MYTETELALNNYIGCHDYTSYKIEKFELGNPTIWRAIYDPPFQSDAFGLSRKKRNRGRLPSYRINKDHSK